MSVTNDTGLIDVSDLTDPVVQTDPPDESATRTGKPSGASGTPKPATQEAKYTLGDVDDDDETFDISGDFNERDAQAALRIADGGPPARQRRVITVPYDLITHAKTSHFVATIVHLLIALCGFVAAGLLPDNSYLQVTLTSAIYDEHDPAATDPKPHSVGSIHVMWMLPGLNLVSAISRFIQWHNAPDRVTETELRDGTHLLQWIEYSIVGSLHLVVVALVVGIRELQILALLASLTAAWSMLMYVVEVLEVRSHRIVLFWYGVFSHSLGWSVILAIYLTRPLPSTYDFITGTFLFTLLLFYIPTVICVYVQHIGCGGCVPAKPYRDVVLMTVDSAGGSSSNYVDLEREWCARNLYFNWIYSIILLLNQIAVLAFLVIGLSHK